MKNIASLYGCTTDTVLHACLRYGFPIHEREGIDIKQEDLLRYCDKGLTTKEISQIYHCSPATIVRRMREYGIPRDGHCRKSISDEQLLEYISEGLSDAEIAKIAGYKNTTSISRRRVHLGIKRNIRTPIEREDLLEHIRSGMSNGEIAEEYHVSAHTITKYLRVYGISRKEEGIHRTKDTSDFDDALINLLGTDLTIKEIATQMGCSTATIYNHMKRLGVRRAQTNRTRKGHVSTRCHIDDEELKRLVADEKTDSEIAEILGCHVASLYPHYRKLGIKRDLRSKRKAQIPIKEFSQLVNEGMSDQELADKYGYSVNTIRQYRYQTSEKDGTTRT